MNHLYKLIFVALVSIFLSGCAASGPKFSEMKSSIPTIAADKGRILFYRPGKFVGAAIQPDVKLNGKVVGESKPGGFFYLDMPAGNYEVTTSTEVDKKLTFVLENKQQKCVRLAIGFGVLVGRVYPELADSAKCDAEIGDMGYTGSAK